MYIFGKNNPPTTFLSDQQHVGQIIHQVDGVGGQGAFAAADRLSTVKSTR
jgi:hypothetical protein